MIRVLHVYYPTRIAVLILCEALIVTACFILATLMVLGGPDTYIALNYEQGLLKILGITGISLMLSYYFDLYEPQLVSLPFEVRFRILLVLGFDCFIVSAILFVYPGASISRYVYAIGFALLAPALLLWRKIYEWTASITALRERVYVLGAGELAHSIVTAIRNRPDISMEVVEWQPVQLDKASRRRLWVETLHRLADVRPPVHRIIVALEDARDELPIEELLDLRFRGIKVEKVDTLFERLYGKIKLDGLRPSSFLYSEGFRMKSSQQAARRVASMIAAATGLLLCLPLFPVIMLLIRLTSPGPVFFRQTRVGLGGALFEVVKFRTMAVDAEAEGARWASKNDPRVTPVGRFLRTTRLDEIPQLWTILRGDMDFVGPRPERPEFVPMLQEAMPFYYLRHLIRPGLTGWAQVRYGYGATMAENREKLEYDLYYIKHMSLGLDLLIMFETIKTIVRRRGAQ
jgi:sugar transferase (PEP-CTERM system associated)